MTSTLDSLMVAALLTIAVVLVQGLDRARSNAPDEALTVMSGLTASAGPREATAAICVTGGHRGRTSGSAIIGPEVQEG
eukprot:1713573-Rhodomonas_salina.1